MINFCIPPNKITQGIILQCSPSRYLLNGKEDFSNDKAETFFENIKFGHVFSLRLLSYVLVYFRILPP